MLVLFNISFAANVPEAPQIYKDAEINGIADGLCKALDFMNFCTLVVSATMFVILGYNGLKGSLNFSSIVTFAIAIGAMRAPGAILELYLPGRGLKYGCKCASYVITVNPVTGKQQWTYNGISEDCKVAPKTTTTVDETIDINQEQQVITNSSTTPSDSSLALQ